MTPERIHDLIEQIADESNGTLTIGYIWQQIGLGRWALVTPNDDMLVLIEEYTSPTGLKIAEAIGVAGENLDKWPQAVANLEAEARARGINRLRGGGRVGWARACKKFGWKVTRVIVEKDLYDA